MASTNGNLERMGWRVKVYCCRVSRISLVGYIVLGRSRGIHSSSIKKMGGGHAHGHDDYEYYLHAKHMYNLDRKKHQKLKMTLVVFTAFSIGVSVPIYAVVFQQKKTSLAGETEWVVRVFVVMRFCG